MTHRDIAALVAAVVWAWVAFAVADHSPGNYTWGAVLAAAGLLAIGYVWWRR